MAVIEMGRAVPHSGLDLCPADQSELAEDYARIGEGLALPSYVEVEASIAYDESIVDGGDVLIHTQETPEDLKRLSDEANADHAVDHAIQLRRIAEAGGLANYLEELDLVKNTILRYAKFKRYPY